MDCKISRDVLKKGFDKKEVIVSVRPIISYMTQILTSIYTADPNH